MSKATITQKKVDYFHLPADPCAENSREVPAQQQDRATQASRRGGRDPGHLTEPPSTASGVYVLWTGCQWGRPSTAIGSESHPALSSTSVSRVGRRWAFSRS